MRMETNPIFRDYSLFHKIIDAYYSVGFEGIDRNDTLIQKLEEMTKANNQYYFISDLLQGKIIFTSKRSKQMIGVDPEELSPHHNIEVIHPEELYRNTNGWGKLLTVASDLLIAKKGFSILSVNMKMRNPEGIYSEILFQCYSFYSKASRETVFSLIVLTNVDSFKMRKHGYHYYLGNDKTYFRYPDKQLLQIGNTITKREFEIIRLIEAGLNTEQISEKLCLSHFTVNTHRGNILKKTKKNQISDLIYDFKERGLL